MKNQFSVLIALALIMQSCGSKTGDSIAENFGGKVIYSQNMLKKDDQSESLNTYMVQIEGSKMLDTLKQGYACASIAIMAYENFTPEQKEEFEQLYVEIKNSDADPTVYYYNPESIEPCAHQSDIYTEFSENLLEEKYNAIAKKVIPKYRTPTLGEELGNFVRPLIQEHGKIESYKRTQFSIVTTKSKQDLYKYEGVLIFKDGYKRPYFITTSPDVENEHISGYQLDIY